VEINEEVENAVDQALIQVDRGAVEKGALAISELYNKHPTNHHVLYGLGVVHAFKEQYDEAITYFDKTIAIFPFFVEAHFNKGIAYQKKFDLGNMLKSFQEVINIGNPDDETTKQAKTIISDMEETILETSGLDLDSYIKSQDVFNKAFSCMEKQQWQKAIAGFKNCSNTIKNHPQSFGNIGICYANLGQKNLALAAFDKALSIDPSYEPAIVNKITIESLKEGETLVEKVGVQTINYYKDYPNKKKSLVK